MYANAINAKIIYLCLKKVYFWFDLPWQIPATLFNQCLNHENTSMENLHVNLVIDFGLWENGFLIEIHWNCAERRMSGV